MSSNIAQAEVKLAVLCLPPECLVTLQAHIVTPTLSPFVLNHMIFFFLVVELTSLGVPDVRSLPDTHLQIHAPMLEA